MKMTKQGVDPKTVLHYATCTNCKSEFEFTMSDPAIQTSHGDMRDPSYKWFKCELCGGQVYIKQ